MDENINEVINEAIRHLITSTDDNFEECMSTSEMSEGVCGSGTKDMPVWTKHWLKIFEK